MADPVSALVAYLKTDGAVATPIGLRIFGGELPSVEARSMPRGALIVKLSGGTSLTAGTFVEHDTQRIDLFAFGPTPFEASQLLARASLALRRLRRGVWAGTLIHWVNSAGGSNVGREPATDWPRAFQSFQVMHALEPVENGL